MHVDVPYVSFICIFKHISKQSIENFKIKLCDLVSLPSEVNNVKLFRLFLPSLKLCLHSLIFWTCELIKHLFIDYFFIFYDFIPVLTVLVSLVSVICLNSYQWIIWQRAHDVAINVLDLVHTVLTWHYSFVKASIVLKFTHRIISTACRYLLWLYVFNSYRKGYMYRWITWVTHIFVVRRVCVTMVFSLATAVAWFRKFQICIDQVIDIDFRHRNI